MAVSAKNSKKKDATGKKKAVNYRRFKVQKLARVSDSFLDKAIRKKGFAQVEVIKKWPQIVGTDLAQACYPTGLKFPVGQKANGMLTVKAESSFAPLLQHRQPYIVEKINQYFGYRAVRGLHIIHARMPVQRRQKFTAKPLSTPQRQKIDQITQKKESDLAQSIRSLGEAVLGKSN